MSRAASGPYQKATTPGTLAIAVIGSKRPCDATRKPAAPTRPSGIIPDFFGNRLFSGEIVEFIEFVALNLYNTVAAAGFWATIRPLPMLPRIVYSSMRDRRSCAMRFGPALHGPWPPQALNLIGTCWICLWARGQVRTTKNNRLFPQPKVVHQRWCAPFVPNCAKVEAL